MTARSRRTAPRRGPAQETPPRKAAKRAASRADFGAPIDGFFAKQPPHLRAILEELRRIVEEVVPDARSSIKWGMPWFTVNGKMMCQLGGHKAHVNLVLVGPAEAFDDPGSLLAGSSQGGRHLKLTSLDELPRDAVRRWLRAAAAAARSA